MKKIVLAIAILSPLSALAHPVADGYTCYEQGWKYVCYDKDGNLVLGRP